MYLGIINNSGKIILIGSLSLSFFTVVMMMTVGFSMAWTKVVAVEESMAVGIGLEI